MLWQYITAEKSEKLVKLLLRSHLQNLQRVKLEQHYQIIKLNVIDNNDKDLGTSIKCPNFCKGFIELWKISYLYPNS